MESEIINDIVTVIRGNGGQWTAGISALARRLGFPRWRVEYAVHSLIVTHRLIRISAPNQKYKLVLRELEAAETGVGSGRDAANRPFPSGSSPSPFSAPELAELIDTLRELTTSLAELVNSVRIIAQWMSAWSQGQRDSRHRSREFTLIAQDHDHAADVQPEFHTNSTSPLPDFTSISQNRHNGAAAFAEFHTDFTKPPAKFHTDFTQISQSPCDNAPPPAEFHTDFTEFHTNFTQISQNFTTDPALSNALYPLRVVYINPNDINNRYNGGISPPYIPPLREASNTHQGERQNEIRENTGVLIATNDEAKKEQSLACPPTLCHAETVPTTPRRLDAPAATPLTPPPKELIAYPLYDPLDDTPQDNDFISILTAYQDATGFALFHSPKAKSWLYRMYRGVGKDTILAWIADMKRDITTGRLSSYNALDYLHRRAKRFKNTPTRFQTAEASHDPNLESTATIIEL